MRLLILAAATLAFGVPAPQSKNFIGAPETFNARAHVGTDAARGDVYVTIHVDKYSSERDIGDMQKALESGGSSGFLQALRKAPVAGRLDVGKQTFTLRWAREIKTAKGRVITLVSDRPVYFVGAGLPDAKPKAGFDLAVIKLDMDSAGIGEGEMAAAAHVKPGGPAGVQVEDYGSEPVKLLSVTRKIQ